MVIPEVIRAVSIHTTVGPGAKAPALVNVFIEIPMNSSVKYEYDEDAGVIRVDRFLYTAMVYPFNYGFIPGTLEEDGDPVDVLVVTSQPVYPGTVMEVKPIGVLITEDEEGPDSKIVAVPKDKLDPQFKTINDIDDLPSSIKEKIRHFFEHYKELEPGKWVKVKEWKGADVAREKIASAINRFNKK